MSYFYVLPKWHHHFFGLSILNHYTTNYCIRSYAIYQHQRASQTSQSLSNGWRVFARREAFAEPPGSCSIGVQALKPQVHIRWAWWAVRTQLELAAGGIWSEASYSSMFFLDVQGGGLGCRVLNRTPCWSPFHKTDEILSPSQVPIAHHFEMASGLHIQPALLSRILFWTCHIPYSSGWGSGGQDH